MTPRRESTLEIRTPEGVVFSLPLAGPASRFVAWLVDGVVVAALSGAVLFFVSFLPFVGDDLGLGIAVFAFFAINIAYGIVLEWYGRGRTLGKFLLGIQVVDIEGLPVTFSQIVLRNLLRAADGLPQLYLVGGTAIVLSPKRQRLGDLAANTVVVRTRKPEPPNWRQAGTGKYNSLRRHPHLVARLRQQTDPQVAELAVQALLRKDSLEAQRQHEVFGAFADYFKGLVAFPPEALFGLSDEQYVRNVIACLYGGDSARNPAAETRAAS